MLSGRADLPGEARSDMQAVHVLADEVLEVPGSLQSQQGHVSQAGPGVFKGRVEPRRLPLLLQRPHALRTPEREQSGDGGCDQDTSFSRYRLALWSILVEDVLHVIEAPIYLPLEEE